MRRSQRTKIHYPRPGGIDASGLATLTDCGRHAHLLYGTSMRFDQVTCKDCLKAMRLRVKWKMTYFAAAEWYWTSALRQALRTGEKFTALVTESINTGDTLS